MVAVRGSVEVPGDKSISHRAAIIGAITDGRCLINGFSDARDCAVTVSLLRDLGVSVVHRPRRLEVVARGRRALRQPPASLDCGRSGTTMRLAAGLLAAAPFETILDGDPQLRRRPMQRVAAPLSSMGADVKTSPGGTPPLRIRGGALRGVRHELAIASAQVKSAILLAGLAAEGETIVVEPARSRDHSERLLTWLGADLRVDAESNTVAVRAFEPPAFSLDVPGDQSSVAPLAAAAAVLPNSDLTVVDVGLNPTRSGFLALLAQMGAGIEEEVHTEQPEPAGRVRITAGELRGVRVESADVPALMDELPLLAVVATQAEGTTEVTGAGELRVKESDRIRGIVAGLRTIGADVEELPDGFVVRGPTRLGGGAVDAQCDHRLAMAFAVAGLMAQDEVRILGMDYVGDSFPGFEALLRTLA